MQNDPSMSPTLELERAIPTEPKVDEPRGWLDRIPEALLLAALYIVTVAVYSFVNNRQVAGLHYFVPLADAFLHGRLDVLDHPPWLNELVAYNGKYFVVYPPMPAVVLMPFVLVLGAGLNQATISIVLGALNSVLLADVCRRLGLKRAQWLTLGLVLGLGTIHWFSAQLGTAWHFAHIVATACMLLAIREAQRGKAPWLMGLFLGGAILSRLPTMGAIPFFLCALIHQAQRQKGPVAAFGAAPEDAFWKLPIDARKLAKLGGLFAAGLAIPLGGLLLYNQARFGSPLQMGYTMIPGMMQEEHYRHGFLSLQSIGMNLYAMLLKAPNFVYGTFPYVQPPVLGGLSLMLTTPLFVWAIKSRRADVFTLGTWAAVVLISLPILLHGDTGGDEFGYRYAMDFYPFLFLLTAKGLGSRFSFEAKLAIAMGFVVNAWGMWATLLHWRG